MVVSPEAKRKLWLPRSPKRRRDESQNSDVAEIGRNILREFKGDFFRNEIKMMEIIYDSRHFLIENRIDRGLSLKIKNSSLPYFSSCLENTYMVSCAGYLLAPTKTFTFRGTDVNIAARRPHPKMTLTKMFSILVTPTAIFELVASGLWWVGLD